MKKQEHKTDTQPKTKNAAVSVAERDQEMLLDNPVPASSLGEQFDVLPTAHRQQTISQLQGVVGNQAVAQMIQAQREDSTASTAVRHKAADNVQLVQRQDTDQGIEVELIEVQSHPGNITELVTDTFRTARGCLMNFHTALENFETRITAESGEEAAPKDPAMIALQQVGTFVLNQLRGQIASAVPGGKIANDLVSLGQSIEAAIQAERRRSAAATDRNAAANFIIQMRTLINNAAVDLETNMTEDIIAVRSQYDSAGSDGQREAIRFTQELINQQITQMEQSTLSPEALFTHLVEAWINETQAPGGRGQPAHIVINLDREWNVREAYLAAPFGSRLAEQLERQGPLNVMDMDVPRKVQWFPFYDQEGGGLYRCFADIPAAGQQATNIGAMGIQSQQFLQEFVNLLGTKPIPEATKITGSRAE